MTIGAALWRGALDPMPSNLKGAGFAVKCSLIISTLLYPLLMFPQIRFKLLLDPNGASDLIPRIFPVCVTHFNINVADNLDSVGKSTDRCYKRLPTRALAGMIPPRYNHFFLANDELPI
jgi:hypothetical protein